jgi:hypothetical protein
MERTNLNIKFRLKYSGAVSHSIINIKTKIRDQTMSNLWGLIAC